MEAERDSGARRLLFETLPFLLEKGLAFVSYWVA